jgi:catechol 2,3-dioxygenase-like lactoylglutathione lyase family enzyme
VAEFRYVYYADAHDESVGFYRDVLGAEQLDGWDGGADVDAFHTQVRERGVNVIEGPRDLSWGHRDFGVREPGGLTLYFFSRV